MMSQTQRWGADSGSRNHFVCCSCSVMRTLCLILPLPLCPLLPSRSLSVSASLLLLACVHTAFNRWPLSLPLHPPHTPLCVIGGSAWMFGSRVTPSQWGQRGPLPSPTHTCREKITFKDALTILCVPVCVHNEWCCDLACNICIILLGSILCRNFHSHSIFHSRLAPHDLIY